MVYKHDGLCGERLSALRKEHGLSQKALVEELEEISDGRCSIETSTYSNMESGKGSKFQYIPIYYLAQFYGVSTDYLLGLNDSPSPDYTIQTLCRHLQIDDATADLLLSITEDNTFIAGLLKAFFCKCRTALPTFQDAVTLARRSSAPISVIAPIVARFTGCVEGEEQIAMLSSWIINEELKKLTQAIIDSSFAKENENG